MSTIRTTLSGLNSRAVDTGRPKSKNISLPPKSERGRCATASEDAQVATCKSQTSGLMRKKKRSSTEIRGRRSFCTPPGGFHGHTIFPSPLCAVQTCAHIFFSKLPGSSSFLSAPNNPHRSLHQIFVCNMESLSETEWDVVINGTGLQQSLLAL